MDKDPKLIIVKLGGSAITNKSKFETLKEEVIRNVADQIQSVLEANHDKIYIALVHGAGSYGHFQARDYGVRQGGRNDSWREGFAATRLSVTRLNHHVVSACISARTAAVGVSPYPHTHYSSVSGCGDDSEGAALAAAVAESLRWGLLPVVHGDAVLSMAPNRCTILSGDIIMMWLAKYLPSQLRVSEVKCIFLTDVDGVYSSFDQETGTPTGMLFRRITVDPDGKLNIPSGIHGKGSNKSRADVTGGLKQKLESAAAISLLGVSVAIVQAGSRSCWQALGGLTPDVGTIISLDVT